jgi:hypothetical protein
MALLQIPNYDCVDCNLSYRNQFSNRKRGPKQGREQDGVTSSVDRKPRMLVIVALANKLARIAWADTQLLLPRSRRHQQRPSSLPCQLFSCALSSLAEQPTHLGVYTRGNVGCIDELFTTR